MAAGPYGLLRSRTPGEERQGCRREERDLPPGARDASERAGREGLGAKDLEGERAADERRRDTEVPDPGSEPAHAGSSSGRPPARATPARAKTT